MATIAVIITDLFEDSEYSEPAKAFVNAGHKLVHVGFQAAIRPTNFAPTRTRCASRANS